MNESPLVLVVGSLNVDQTLRVPRLPAPGETVTARKATTCFGGKGANQAVAAQRAGGRVRMIGCVGNDEQGARYREQLAAEGIDTTGIAIANDPPTGSAVIMVDETGENCIVVNPGANHVLSEAHLESSALRFEGVAALLVQLECPLKVVRLAAEMARSAGARVILNPSPWTDRVRRAAIPADVIIVNQSEARALSGGELAGLPEDPDSLLSVVGCDTLIVTRGAESTRVISTNHGCFEVAPPGVTPVDTVGAGDAFAGAFAVAHSEGRSLRDAVEFANAAGALATLQRGAQSAIPSREQIRLFALKALIR